jgi:alkylation response protein AidB-like acyl-CoA dehydrogenase
MDFVADEAQQMIREAVRDFAEGAVRASAGKWDSQADLPASAMKELGNLGLFGMAAPERLGGIELDAQSVTAALEELGAAEAGLAQLVVQHGLCLDHVVRAGGQDAAAKRLASGKQLGCHAHGEDADDLDSAEVKTQATRDGDGWRLTGEKPAVIGASRASLAVVTAQVAGEAGLTAFLVPLDLAGISRKPVADMMGLRTAGAATILLQDAQLDDAARLGPVGGAAVALEPALDTARLGTAAVALGVARSALREAGRYSQERHQFNKPISAFQPIQWMIADAAVELETARLLVGRAAWQVSQGKPSGAAIAMAKTRACDVAMRIADRAIQVLGGYGFTTDFPVERAYRDAAVLKLLQGSGAWHRVRIARSLAR